MKASLILAVLAALALAGCGESRYLATAPDGTGGVLPGSGGGGGGGGGNCQDLTTLRQCVGKGGSDPLMTGLVINSTGTTLSLSLPVEYSSERRAQAFKVVLVGLGGTYEFRRPGASCAVVEDIAGLDGTQVRDVGSATGVAPGTYTVFIRHGLDDPCYDPPANADVTASNWLVVGPGTLTVCN